jgi:indolepyruvate decarboxylase
VAFHEAPGGGSEKNSYLVMCVLLRSRIVPGGKCFILELLVTLTVIQHVLSRLQSIGVADVLGVPGDFAFPVNDAICEDPRMRWIGCCNELNAAYAADGYARIKGIGAICTTYGVRKLSALNGIAGAYAEHLPLFRLVGTPKITAQSARALIHHTLGKGKYECALAATA